jgi:hypothetical protein
VAPDLILCACAYKSNAFVRASANNRLAGTITYAHQQTGVFFYAHIGYNAGMTMQAAKDLARQRWKNTTKKQRQQVAVALTEARKQIPPEVRKAAASAAAKARWDKAKKARQKL